MLYAGFRIKSSVASVPHGSLGSPEVCRKYGDPLSLHLKAAFELPFCCGKVQIVPNYGDI